MHDTNGRRVYLTRAALGIGAYLLVALAPVGLMFLPPAVPARELLREFSVALAFSAAGILGLEFATAARIKPLKAPYGIDAVYYFHRNMALVALGFVVLHPLLLFVVTPARIALLNVFTAPWAARFAVAAVLALAAITATSLWRLRLRLTYEPWKIVHGLLALAVLVLATLHIIPAGIYTEGWRFWVFALYPVLWVAFFAYLRLGKPLYQLRHPYRVVCVQAETPDTWTLHLRPDGHKGLSFRPGQFLWIKLGVSPFSFQEHPFSFSSSAVSGDGGFDVTVKELGDFTATIGSTEPGTVAYVDGPFGAFTTDRYPSDRYVFLAGGIGITPIMSILRTAAAQGRRERFVLAYGAATAGDVAFAEELEQLKERLDLEVVTVLEKPPEGWQGHSGFITRQVLEPVLGDPGGWEFFVCGPPAMIGAMEKVLGSMAVEPKRLHYERFAFV